MHRVREELPAKVTQEILENVSINGAAPLTQASLKEIVGEMSDQIVNGVELRIPNFVHSELRDHNSAVGPIVENSARTSPRYESFLWCNPHDKKCKGQPKHHPIPKEGFKVPSANVFFPGFYGTLGIWKKICTIQPY